MRLARVLALCALMGMSGVRGHIALWDEGMYGYDPADSNQQEPVTPLFQLPFSSWWFHGYLHRPPAPGKYMTLPAGGTYHGQVACNKAFTSLGTNPSQQHGIYACEGDDPAKGGIGAMHTTDRWKAGVGELKDVTGCAIAIAYESDPAKIKPEDFVVISTNHTCPWFKNVDFQIPADLPPCPEGNCHCLWGWVPSGRAGRQENYILNYRCRVTGAREGRAVPKPQVARKCNYPTDTSNCTVGAKQPHYWLQAERNNIVQDIYDGPKYNGLYGFRNGAQTDLWAAAGGAQPAQAPQPQPQAQPQEQPSQGGQEATLQRVAPQTEQSEQADRPLRQGPGTDEPSAFTQSDTSDTSASSSSPPAPLPSATRPTFPPPGRCRRKRSADLVLPAAHHKNNKHHSHQAHVHGHGHGHGHHMYAPRGRRADLAVDKREANGSDAVKRELHIPGQARKRDSTAWF